MVNQYSLIDYTKYYIDHPDVLRANHDALGHFLEHGYKEGRKYESDIDLGSLVERFRAENENGTVAEFVAFARGQIAVASDARSNAEIVRGVIEKFQSSKFKESSAANEILRSMAPPLNPYEFAKSKLEKARVNLVVPALSDSAVFGGIKTALDFFQSIIVRYSTQFDFRIISQDNAELGSEITDLMGKHAFQSVSMEVEGSRLVVAGVRRGEAALPVRAKEIFITTFWATSVTIQRAIDDLPSDTPQIIHLLQDYEPNFYPENTHKHLCINSLLHPSVKAFVVNSLSLAEFVQTEMVLQAPLFPFTPRLNSHLRPKESMSRANILLFYARRNPRNLLDIGKLALAIFGDKYPEIASQFDYLGVGDVEGAVPISKNVTLNCLGKLSLEAYSSWLSISRVGLSLMAAPHPSYPPLEMAYNGIRVVTNDYRNRKMAGVHENIVSSPTIAPEPLADLLAQQCRIALEMDCVVASPYQSFMEGFESDDDPFFKLHERAEFESIFKTALGG